MRITISARAWMIHVENFTRAEARTAKCEELAKEHSRKEFLDFYNECAEWKIKYPKAHWAMDKALENLYNKPEEMNYE